MSIDTLSPEDTGEIPTFDDITQLMPPYVDQPPMRRPTADDTGEVRLAEALIAPGLRHPDAPEAYIGRHRAPEDMPADVPPGRWGALRSVMATAWARIRRSM